MTNWTAVYIQTPAMVCNALRHLQRPPNYRILPFFIAQCARALIIPCLMTGLRQERDV